MQLRMRCILRCLIGFGRSAGPVNGGWSGASSIALSCFRHEGKIRPAGNDRNGTPGTSRARFFRTLKLADLVLAKACAAGNDRAWEHFMAQFMASP